MRARRLIALVLLLWGVALCAVESGEQPMTIMSAETKLRDRVVAWVHDTPIYQQDPYFAVVVRAGDRLLEGERDPEHPYEMLPTYWKPGIKVQGRVQGHSLYLKRPNGAEMRFVILKRSKAQAEQSQ